jgi:hypothetical protein
LKTVKNGLGWPFSEKTAYPGKVGNFFLVAKKSWKSQGI